MGQSARQNIISKFRSTPTPNNSRSGIVKRVLVVQESLARGLSEVGPVGLVVNFDLPRVVEDYSGRLVLLSPLLTPNLLSLPLLYRAVR